MKKIIALLLVLIFVSSISFAGGDAEGTRDKKEKYTIATVVKIDGISWFNRMRVGVENFGRDTGHDTFLQGPAQADAAQQVQIIENLIAQGVDAIAVVPFSPEALEPVLKKARDAGIIVVVHEATTQQNVDVIIEAFPNPEFGRQMAFRLSEFMGGSGEIASFVGSLTSKSHNEQQDGVEAFVSENSSFEIVAARNEDYDDRTRAYERTKELLTTYPNLKGIVGSPSSAAPGAGLAVEERGLTDKVSVVGVATPNDSRDLINSGAVDAIAFWDPADAGYVMNEIAVRLLNGESITDGMDLGVSGYTSIKQDSANSKLFFGEAWVFVDKNNINNYDF